MRSSTVLACLAVLVCLSGPAGADFLAGGQDGNTGQGFAYLMNDDGTVKTTLWTGGANVRGLAMDPTSGNIYMGRGGTVYVTTDHGTNWNTAFDLSSGSSIRGMVVKNGVMYVSSWYNETLTGWDLATNTQVVATGNLFQDLPGYVRTKFQQLIIGPASLNHDILGAAFYGETYGTGAYRWDGVNTDPTTCVTKVAGVPFFCTGLAAVGNNALYLSNDTHDGSPANTSYVGLADPTVGGAAAPWKDYGAPPTGPYTYQLLAKSGKLYVANGPNSINAANLDILSQADGSVLASIPLAGLRVLSDALLDGDSNRNGAVDFADYQILETRFGNTSGQNWEDGDFDYDGDVDFADYQKLEVKFGQSVPEPATAVLLTVALAGMVRRRGR